MYSYWLSTKSVTISSVFSFVRILSVTGPVYVSVYCFSLLGLSFVRVCLVFAIRSETNAAYCTAFASSEASALGWYLIGIPMERQ